MKKLRIEPDESGLDDLIDLGVRLHGHSGPFLIAGIRAGLLGLKLLDHPGYFGIRAESEAGTEPPVSCFTDGVQIGSGCTIGKGNLHVRDVPLPAAIAHRHWGAPSQGQQGHVGGKAQLLHGGLQGKGPVEGMKLSL